MEVQLRCQAHQMRVRTRLLHTCILYLSIIVCKIYKKVASQPGLLGSLARTFPLSLAIPILHAIQRCILALASFADDQIIACENRIEQLLPLSSYLFDMLEWIVQYMIDTLPAKFDEVARVAEFLIEWFSREERSSCVLEEKEIVMDSNCTQSALTACSSLVNDKEEKAMVDEELYNSLHQCEEHEPADKVKRLDAMAEEDKKAAKRKGGKKKRQAKIVEVEVPHNEMKDGEKHQISDGVGEGKESVEGLAKWEYKKEDEGDRILHLFEQGWIMH